MAAKKPAPKAEPKARKSHKYHVYKISDDLGEVNVGKVTPLEDIVNMAHANVAPARGLFFVIDENGSVDIVHLGVKEVVDVQTFVPKDLFR